MVISEDYIFVSFNKNAVDRLKMVVRHFIVFNSLNK